MNYALCIMNYFVSLQKIITNYLYKIITSFVNKTIC